jgi:hypothetical protein
MKLQVRRTLKCLLESATQCRKISTILHYFHLQCDHLLYKCWQKYLRQNKLHIVHIDTENEPSKSILELVTINVIFNLSHWSFDLKRGSASALLLGLRVWIAKRAWIFFGACCLMEVSATDRSLVRRSPTERNSFRWMLPKPCFFIVIKLFVILHVAADSVV